jgi:hypothetical protein
LAFMCWLPGFGLARPDAPLFSKFSAFRRGMLDEVLKISCRKLQFCGIVSHGVDFW